MSCILLIKARRFALILPINLNSTQEHEGENKTLINSISYVYQCVVFLQATNLITKKELLTMDPDTDDGQLVYEITAEPKHGFLESKQKPGSAVTTFTQGREPRAEPAEWAEPRVVLTAASSRKPGNGNIIFRMIPNAKKHLMADGQYYADAASPPPHNPSLTPHSPPPLTHLKVI